MYATLPLLFDHEAEVLIDAVRIAYRTEIDKAMTGIIDREYHAHQAHAFKRILEVLSPKHIGH